MNPPAPVTRTFVFGHVLAILDICINGRADCHSQRAGGEDAAVDGNKSCFDVFRLRVEDRLKTEETRQARRIQRLFPERSCDLPLFCSLHPGYLMIISQTLTTVAPAECVVCGSMEPAALLYRGIVRCGACGHVSADMRLTDEEL